MPAIPTYGSIFVYGAAEAPDKLRLSGPAPVDPPNDSDPWEGQAGDFGLPVDEWSDNTHPGYPSGPPWPGDPTWIPTPSWLYGVNVPDGTYTRIVKPRWGKV